MSEAQLEQRLVELERELSELRSRVDQLAPKKPWWERIAGTFHNDPAYLEAMRLGREYRESQRDELEKDPE